jgi:hypothetical protein
MRAFLSRRRTRPLTAASKTISSAGSRDLGCHRKNDDLEKTYMPYTKALVLIPLACAALLVGPACAVQPSTQASDTMKLESPAFAHQGQIPVRFTCEGGDISPPLAWSDLPAGTKSLALIVDDPDAPDPKAPKMTWVHWVLYNLPAEAGGLPEGVKSENLPTGTQQGLNDWGRTGYGGPCPPIGQHRYFHKLYALDTVLPDLGQANKPKLEQAMQGHILGKSEYIGAYKKR